MGFILLGEIIERLTGESLDAFAKREIFRRLGMDRSMFNPPRKLREDIAPTEMDSAFRKRLIWGEVHDENAWAMGGVAGHAGLFSTAGDIAAFAQMILNGGIYGHERMLAGSTIRQFTARQTIGGSARTLGWDVPEEPSSSGPLLFAFELWPYRIHRHVALDRSRAEAVRYPADQPREPHARQRQDPSGAPGAARRCLRGPRAWPLGQAACPITPSAQSLTGISPRAAATRFAAAIIIQGLGRRLKASEDGTAEPALARA